jgi:fatty-acyl-CoA synthase
MNLADVFRHDVRHYAGKVAIRIDGTALTYAELARRVDETAQVLGAHVAPGDRVGLWLHNSFAWLASFLALNALGAVSVPINTRLTAAECGTILRDARVRTLVTTRRYRGRDYLDEALSGGAARRGASCSPPPTPSRPLRGRCTDAGASTPTASTCLATCCASSTPRERPRRPRG